MDRERADRPTEDRHAQLERKLIADYLRSQGYEPEQVNALPRAEAEPLLKAASSYASGKLSEMEARSHYVDEMHRGHRED